MKRFAILLGCCFVFAVSAKAQSYQYRHIRNTITPGDGFGIQQTKLLPTTGNFTIDSAGIVLDGARYTPVKEDLFRAGKKAKVHINYLYHDGTFAGLAVKHGSTLTEYHLQEAESAVAALKHQ